MSIPCHFPSLAFLAAGLGVCHQASKWLHPPFRSVSPPGFRDHFCLKHWPLGFADHFKNPYASSRAGVDVKGVVEVCPFGSEELPVLTKDGHCLQMPVFPSGSGLTACFTLNNGVSSSPPQVLDPVLAAAIPIGHCRTKALCDHGT